MLKGADGWDTGAVSSPFVAEIERVQQRLDQGPRVEAARQANTVVSGSLTGDDRWPTFAAEIRTLDVRSALAQPLITPMGVVGTLTIYAEEENAFDALALQLATAFGGPAAVAAYNARSAPEAPARETPVQERGVIERALGIMMSRSACSQDRAILRLQKMSEAEHQHLASMAQAVIDEALVETAANYLQVREPVRPFGRQAPTTEPKGALSSSWLDEEGQDLLG